MVHSNDPKNLWAYPWANDVAQSWICQLLQASTPWFRIHLPKKVPVGEEHPVRGWIAHTAVNDEWCAKVQSAARSAL